MGSLEPDMENQSSNNLILDHFDFLFSYPVNWEKSKGEVR